MFFILLGNTRLFSNKIVTFHTPTTEYACSACFPSSLASLVSSIFVIFGNLMGEKLYLVFSWPLVFFYVY